MHGCSSFNGCRLGTEARRPPGRAGHPSHWGQGRGYHWGRYVMRIKAQPHCVQVCWAGPGPEYRAKAARASHLTGPGPCPSHRSGPGPTACFGAAKITVASSPSLSHSRSGHGHRAGPGRLAGDGSGRKCRGILVTRLL